MKTYKPYHVLIFLVAVLLILAPIVWFVPAKGWTIGDFKIRFMTFEKFSNPVKKVNKDITTFIADVDTVLNEEETEPLFVDTLDKKIMGMPSGGKLNLESATHIAFSESGLKRFQAFLTKLEGVASSQKKLRILHYGDSQIEGDRMTAYIRQRVQEQFGGNGAGMIPAVNVYNTISYIQRVSPNFTRYTCFGGEKIKSKQYGIMNSVGRFTPEYLDSTERANITSIKEAWVEIEPSKSAHGRSRNYNNVQMHYTGAVKPCKMKVYHQGNLIRDDSLVADGKHHVYRIELPQNAGKLRFEFSSAISPNILGYSLEGDLGVQVDNIAMRGSSGTFFGNIDQSLAAKMYSEMNVELIIMQFGGNSVPHFKDSSGVRNFARYFKGQLQTIRRLRPSAAIVVIGPSDMSRFEDGMYTTYPLLPYCVEQLRKSAMEVEAGYYDLYSAMGGENSMPAWVAKGLAGNDYIHFSNRGSSIASQLFYDAFSSEYAKWKTQ